MQVKIELITCPHSDINSSFVLKGTGFDFYSAYKTSCQVVAFDKSID